MSNPSDDSEGAEEGDGVDSSREERNAGSGPESDPAPDSGFEFEGSDDVDPKKGLENLDAEDISDLPPELKPELIPPEDTSSSSNTLREFGPSSFMRLLLICLVASTVVTFPNPIAHIVIATLTSFSMVFLYVFLVEFSPYPDTTYLGTLWGKRGKVIESYLVIFAASVVLAFGFDLIFTFE